MLKLTPLHKFVTGIDCELPYFGLPCFVHMTSGKCEQFLVLQNLKMALEETFILQHTFCLTVLRV